MDLSKKVYINILGVILLNSLFIYIDKELVAGYYQHPCHKTLWICSLWGLFHTAFYLVNSYYMGWNIERAGNEAPVRAGNKKLVNLRATQARQRIQRGWIHATQIMAQLVTAIISLGLINPLACVAYTTIQLATVWIAYKMALKFVYPKYKLQNELYEAISIAQDSGDISIWKRTGYRAYSICKYESLLSYALGFGGIIADIVTISILMGTISTGTLLAISGVIGIVSNTISQILSVEMGLQQNRAIYNRLFEVEAIVAIPGILK